MVKSFLETAKKVQKANQFEIANSVFTDQLISNQSFQTFQLISLKFCNCEFKNIDFSGSWFIECEFKNCNFENITSYKCNYWNCKFENVRILNSNLTRSEFDSTSFQNSQFFQNNFRASDFSDCKFKETTSIQSNLELIMVSDVQFWQYGKWVQINDSLNFQNMLIDMSNN